MGYLKTSSVIDALQEDKETSLMCYDDKATRDIVKFCYESMAREIDRLPQYQLENVVERTDNNGIRCNKAAQEICLCLDCAVTNCERYNCQKCNSEAHGNVKEMVCCACFREVDCSK